MKKLFLREETTTVKTPEVTTPKATEIPTTKEFYQEPETEQNPKNVKVDTYFNKIDTASSTKVSTSASEGIENLFDGNKNTKMCTMDGFPLRISWQMDRATVLKKYTLTTVNDNEQCKGRNPKSWILYGSKDGNNWETIDVVNDSSMEDKNFKTYNYTVDKVGTYQYYKLDVQAIYGSGCQISGISMKGATVSPSKYDILFTGDWKDVTVDGYLEELTKLFYNSYPRLYQRWGNGTEPTTITFKADNNYDGVAYCQGTTVCVSTAYANSHPTDIGFFSHEITHSVQQYSGKLNYGDDVAWWTENMANYGGFRYFHWSNPKYVQIYEATDTSLQDWGYQQYGNNKWFFAYMDSKYPTRKMQTEH